MKNEALEVIAAAPFITLATVQPNGQPYATPLKFTFENGYFRWESPEDAEHCNNTNVNDRVYITAVDTSHGDARAIYVQSVARPINEGVFSDKWQKVLVAYEAELGELDEKKTTPGRFYFQGVKA